MSRLTADERRRVSEIRRAADADLRRPMATAAGTPATAPHHPWTRTFKTGALAALAAAAALAVTQVAASVTVRGATSVIEWLLPRV